MPSPVCEVKDGAGDWQTTVAYGAVVTPSNVITIRLANVADVDIWELEAVGSDEETDFAAISIAIDMVTKTATFTQPSGVGTLRTILFRSVVNQGRNANRTRNASLTTTFGVFVEGSGGDRVLATNERFETDAVYGWIVDINRRIRSASSCCRLVTDADWYLDPIDGDDSNDGLTDVTPVKTFANLRDVKWGCGAILAQWTTVHIMNSQPDDTDPLDIDDGVIRSYYGIGFSGRGYTTADRSGSFTAVTVLDRPTNIPCQITDSGQAGTWTTDLYQRVQIVGGARDGAAAWAAKDLGAKKARVSGFRGTSNQAITPQVGDAYEVQSLPQVYSNTIPRDLFCDFEYLSVEIYTWHNTFTFSQCKFDGFGGFASYLTFYNCCTQRGMALNGLNVVTYNSGCIADATSSGVGTGTYGLRVDGQLTLAFDVFIQSLGRGIDVYGHSSINIHQAGLFDCSGKHFTTITSMDGVITIGTNGNGLGAGWVELVSRYVVGVSQTDSALYGSGNSGPLVHPHAGGRFSYEATRPPTATSDEDFRLDNATTARAFDEATGAYTTARACTWALLETTVAGGGFAGNAHNVGGNAHITSLSL